jgi:hypothetical protein
MITDTQYNPFIFIGITMCFIVFNLYTYRNYLFVSICVGLILVFVYSTFFKHKTKYAQEKNLKHILKGIKLKQLSGDNHVTLKVPKKFPYLLITDTLNESLFNLRFLNRYYEESFVRIVVLLESFLKIYYNIITYKYDPSRLENMKDLYESFLIVTDEIYMNIPKYKRNSKKDYHVIVNRETRRIKKIMMQKIKVILSLRNINF